VRWFRRSPEEQRVKAARTVRDGPLAAYLNAPFPDENAAVLDAEFLALDFEATGVDPKKDHVVAVGFVPVVGGRIELAGARSFLVNAPVEVGASATVHGLTDDTVATGMPIAQAAETVLAALRGRVLLAHFAPIEVGFLRRACAELFGGPFPCLVVDTLALQRRLVAGAFPTDPPPGSLRLWAARERYRLPVYRAHDPLIDAQSCAELFLAQVAELGADKPLTLKRILV